MPVPDYQTLMLPVLRAASNGETTVKTCVDQIAREFNLSEDDLAELLESGHQTRLANRIHWATTYLANAGLLERTGRGRFRATARGLDVLHQAPERIDNRYLGRFDEFRAFLSRRGERAAASRSDGGVVVAQPERATATPEEIIEAAHDEITEELRGELLGRLMAGSPRFFEKVIVDLMIAMGYGGARPDAGQRIGRGGDGGIDGVINEDALGLDVVFLQAKRYSPENTIGVEKVREFAGALVERGASKGVFVTTSHFATGALTYADRVPQRLILIDGEELTRLMVRYGVGVRTTRTVEIKKLDLDYFEEEIVG